MSFFQVLGLEGESFDQSTEDLERRYKDAQRRLHPDKFTTRSPREREFSADQASLVNVAYTTLKDPLRRARYILQRRGAVADQEYEGTIDDPGLLMMVMEAREDVRRGDSIGIPRRSHCLKPPCATGGGHE